MSSHRSRGQSPPRYYADQPRATTGALYVTSFDNTSSGGPSSLQTRSSTGTIPSGRSSVTYQAQPTRKSTYADGKIRTEYAIRPKHEPSHRQTESKRPLSISTRNNSPPRRSNAFVASPREMDSSMRDDSSRLLQPAVGHGHGQNFHQRHNSASMTDLHPRDLAINRDRRDKSYHVRSPHLERVYHDSRSSARLSDDDQWSYTGPREQFDRDYPQRGHANKDHTSRRERPTSHYETDRPSTRRDAAQSESIRAQPVRRDKNSHDRYDTKPEYDSDPDRRSEAPKRRHTARPAVLHQQLLRDDGYSSARDDYESRGQAKHKNGRQDDDVQPKDRHRDSIRANERDREHDRRYHKDPDRERIRDSDRDYDRNYDRDYDREYDRDRDRDHDRRHERDSKQQDGRRKPRSREQSPERSGLREFATTALSGLAAAGVMKGFNRDRKDRDDDIEHEEPKERRRRKHRRRSDKDDKHDHSDHDSDQRRDDRTQTRARDSSGSDAVEDQAAKRPHSHRRRREDEAALNDQLAAPEEREHRSASKGRTRDEDKASSDADRPSRELVLANPQDHSPEPDEHRTISPGENEDDRPRRVQLVEPVREKEDIKPKGILKPARQVPFPEDPNPVREGVAPLKDASKGGIPPKARWTKINRLLVNPEALEKARERFEEREDYVIVLRVLTREEIKKLADKTKEIRDAREREWQEQLDDQRHRPAGDSKDELDYHDGNYEDRPQLAIEQRPATASEDWHSLSGQQNQSATRSLPGGLPMTDVDVEANYSQNV